MQFLRGDFSGKKIPLRPPWAVDEADFTAICDRCGDCIQTCPTKIIKKDRGSFPVIDFSRGECTFCADCVTACKPGALLKIQSAVAWQIVATIDHDKCIAFKKVECRSCYDPCETKAIKMKARVSGIAMPSVNGDNCNGCGACIAVCPTQAINMQKKPEAL